MNEHFMGENIGEARHVRIYRTNLNSWDWTYSLQDEKAHSAASGVLKKGYLWQELRYNDKKVVIESVRYSSDGKIDHRLVNSYDEAGHLLNSKEEGIDCPRPVTNVYTRDPAERKITKVQYFDNEVNEKEHTWVNERDQVIKTELFDWEDHLLNRVEKEYDDTGHLLVFKQYDGDGNEMIQIDHTYDDEGNILNETETVDGESIVRNFFYETGKLVKETWIEDGIEIAEISRYDEKGNRTAVVKKRADIEETEEDDKTIFDDSGNVIADINSIGSALAVKKTVYDEKNRVIESIDNRAEMGVIVKVQRSFNKQDQLEEVIYIYSQSGRYSSGGESFYLFYEYE